MKLKNVKFMLINSSMLRNIIFCLLFCAVTPSFSEPILVSENTSLIKMHELTEIPDRIPAALFEKMFTSHKLVGSKGLIWKKQSTITIAFQGGSKDLYELIANTANEWTSLGGQLKFSFHDDTGQYRQWTNNDKSPAANIRIAFREGSADRGYWSLLGVLASNVDAGDPTMNFGGFPTKLNKYYKGKNLEQWMQSYEHSVILHEFGHALGLSHEHFNSQCQNDLKMDSIIASLMDKPNMWTKDQARFNMDFDFYKKMLSKSAFPRNANFGMSPSVDQHSVMLYSFPVEYYKSGKNSVCRPLGEKGQNYSTKISPGDKNFYLENYSKIARPF